MSFDVIERNFEDCSDFQKRIVSKSLSLYYLESIVKVDEIEQFIIQPIQNHLKLNPNVDITVDLLTSTISSLSFKTVNSYSEILKGIIEGNTFISLDKNIEGLLVSTPNWTERGLEEAYGERSLKGPKVGFTEKTKTNINILRSILKTPELIVEKMSYGKYAETDISIVYIKSVVDRTVLRQVKARISNLDVNFILESRIVEDALEGEPKTFVDLSMSTERVDTTTSALLDGKVIVLVDGNPYSIIVPTLFVDFFQASDDFHIKTGRLINRPIRFIGFLASILLPGVYLALEKFHSKEFSKTIQEGLFNKGEVLPTFWEVFILLLLFKVLLDVGTRSPKSTVILVSLIATIVIGETAVTANIIHPSGLIVVGLSTFLSFLITYRGQIGVVFTLRYLFLFACNFFDFSGMIVLATILILYFTQLRSLNVPYLAPLIPFRIDEFQDVFFRGTLKNLNNKQHDLP